LKYETRPFFWFKELMKIEIKKKEKRDLYRYQPERSFKDRKKRSQEKCDQPANRNEGKKLFRRGRLQELVGVSGQSNQSYIPCNSIQRTRYDTKNFTKKYTHTRKTHHPQCITLETKKN